MDGCRINTKEEFKSRIVKIIRNIAKQSRDQGSQILQDFIKDTLEEIKKSPNSEEQRTLFKSALFDCYKPDSIFNDFLSERLTYVLASQLFNPSYDLKLAEDNTVSSTYEETAKASKIQRQRNFLGTMFKDAPNSKLYFQRRVKNDMVEIFLVDRSGDNPRYFTSQEEINLNVREYKQKLLDKIFDYINNRPLTKIKLPGNYRQMYIKGKYTNNLKQIKSIIDSELSPEVINKSKGTQLDEYYETYRDSIKNQKEQENALKFLEAYNAWIILQNFDTILEDTIGTVVSINSSSTYNKHTGDLKKYSIINKATNIWRNWTSTDDIADMAEVISDVTQMLVETSKMYSWQNNEPFQDKQLSFHDFNYGIGLIKRLADLHASANINLNNLQWNEGHKQSLETQRILLSILGFNRANKIFQKNADGSDSNIPQPPTLKSVIARINENPQRYLPVLFEIVCNTNLLNKINEHLEEKIGSYEKNILWSLYKEIFGEGQDSPRSLYRLHNLSETDNVYQILTQVAASTFPEDYLQYYEKHDNSIGTRLLKDYAIDEVRRSIYGNLRQTSFAFNPSQYSKYGITVESRQVNNYTVLGNIKISIPINSADSNKKFNFQLGFNGSYMQPLNYTPEQYEMIWNDTAFKNLIKDFLGINFSNDPDFKSAYLEINSNNAALAVQDLSNILVNAVFNSAVNNIYLPRQKNINEISNFKNFIKNQYGDSEAPKFMDGQTFKTEMIHIIPVDKRIGFLGKLAMAKAITNNLLSQAQSKTGEGTSLANYVLSRMRNFYHNQIEMQCKKESSAVRNLDFVVNANGLFEGILTRREMKTNQTNQQTTKFSDQQSFQVSFISDFLSAFVPDPDDNDFFKNGKVSFLPTVNSDKPQIDGLQVNLYAESGIKDNNGKYKRFIELTDSEIEQEMIRQFKPMYNRIVENINIELTKVQDLLRSKGIKVSTIKNSESKIFNNQVLLNDINKAFKDNTELGKTAKDRITNGLHSLLTEYNKTHSRNPIALAQQVHYVFNKEGLLTNNNVLAALHGRFNSDAELSPDEQEYFKSLYRNESNYLDFLKRNGLTNPSNSESFFKWQNHLTVKDLLRMNFKVYLRGSDAKVRHNSKEIQFLRGEASFSKEQLSDPKFKYLIDLNNEMKNWISEEGLMVIARGVVAGEIVDITNENQLNQAHDLQLHPMLSKLNRLDYLCTQQYVVSTVGSHYVHSGKADPGYVLIEEAKRWLASNKRNVAATSTVHLFQNKQLNGSPTKYNLAIMEDVVADLYTIMGDLYLEGHKPLDGGMFVDGFISDLENNSLAGEAAGGDKKHFGTFYHENYAAGGIIKTAGFAVTNDRMRRDEAWQNLQKAMSSRLWVKEYPGEDRVDIPEVRDITKDYLNRSIAYKDVVKDRKIMYQRVAHDNPDELATYELYDITYQGNNQYIIREIEIDEYGNPVTGDIITRSEPVLDIDTDRDGYDLRSGSFDEDGNPLQSTLITINNNWDLFNKVFGGRYSLELGDDGKLTYSENSIRLMVHAINNVGYRKGHNLPKQEAQRMSDELSRYINTLDSGLDQDDIWLPLKHSDIHFVPNIGAIKSLQFNVNPDGEAILEGKETLNFFQIRLAQLGIQLDKEHHADAADVSMPTQIIQALANKSYTSEYAKEVYTALSTLTRQATKEFLKGVQDIITSNDPAKLTEEVTKLILDNILSKKEEESSVDVILADLIEKASQGKEIKYAEDIKGKFPWSDPTINNKLFSTLSTTLTNLAVKMRFSGSLSVICPTEKVESLRGDRLFSSFTKIYNENGQKGKPATRTTRSDINLQNYQKSVYDGNEVDSDGKNMLVFDISRDMITFPKKEENESNAEYQDRIRKDFIKKRLSKTSELKTQHNYIIEFVDGTTEKVSINSPETYYYIKNLVVNGRKSDKLLELDTPISYETLLIDTEQKISQVDLSNDPKVIVAGYLSNAVLTQESVMKETGIGRGDIKKLFGLFKSKANGGISVDKLAHKIWEDNSSVFSSDQDVKNLIIELIGEASTTAHFKSYEKVRIKEMAKEAADKEYESYQQYILDTYKMDTALYEYYYDKLSKQQIPVRKIYENVIDKRPLGAYNVRFSDKLGNRYQIFDLDSINLLFKLNNLRSDKSIKGYTKFNEQSPEKQQKILNLIFNSKIFREFSGNAAWSRLQKKFTNLPVFDRDFVANFNELYPGLISEFAQELYRITKPRIFNLMQNDLFKLSDNYKGKDRQIRVNGELIDPVDIESQAYELIMPKVYKTQFGLQEFDDLQEILRDKDFFVKRGIKRFACKLDHQYYDYELKNFNGNHIYVLDKSKGIPEDVAQSISTLHWDTKGKKIFRTDSQGKPIHELSSSKDDIAEINGVTVILTDNPLFYVQNFNYNTLKVSPNRVTEESYQKLIEVLSQSKRKNSKNYLKAISKKEGEYLNIDEFKEFNRKLDSITYVTIKADISPKDLPAIEKSVAQICRIILKNGRELHTSFNASLDLIAGRIPAQSQQSFMTQRVVAFDNSDINTAMVSTFQLFLQGSDLDIDAVTLLGYEFDKNGKFIGWSPYFDIEHSDNLEASKKMPLPTGELREITFEKDRKTTNGEITAEATPNFFKLYNKYFGTLFNTIKNEKTGGIITENKIPKLQLQDSTPEGLELLAQFLRDFNQYGINIKADIDENEKIVATKDFFKRITRLEKINETTGLKEVIPVEQEWNLFADPPFGLGIGYNQAYGIAKQLLDIANTHNDYLNTADEYLRDGMSRNYSVHYMYKSAAAACNQTEAMISVDVPTDILRGEAGKSIMAEDSDNYAPGRVSAKVRSVGEGQAGKDGVGIGAVGIKANSTTQFYISELLNYGSDSDKEKVLFRKPKRIGKKEYWGFDNMYTGREVSDHERIRFQKVWDYIDTLTSEDQVTNNVAINIAAMLSVSVDNAKDLVLAKINSGPRLMGLYIYGMTLGVPIETLSEIMRSEEGMILKEMTEGSLFNNDISSFKVLDVFKKLDGNIFGELQQYSMVAENSGEYPVKIDTELTVNEKYLENIGSTVDILFSAMYPAYIKWFNDNKEFLDHILQPASDLNTMIRHLFSVPRKIGDFNSTFEYVYDQAKDRLSLLSENIKSQSTEESYKNWDASMKQMVMLITDIAKKSRIMQQGRGKDLKTLAEGAEEMRILGSILSINKGLKTTFADAETFIDTIENLIYDRKKAMGDKPLNSDKIDFHKFFTDMEYQNSVIEAYEKIKHSVNIPHLISKVPHFKGYLQTQMLPTITFITNSVKFRALHKYRNNVNADNDSDNPLTLFNMFEVDGKKDKQQIIKGLENLIHFKLFARWAYDNDLQFQVPKGFKYFTNKETLASNPNGPTTIKLYTEAGLATFKKYMEEIYIPALKESPYNDSNEFVKNLQPRELDNTPIHSTIVAYSLPGDLMARKGRQAELNAKMFGDFSRLSGIKFQTNDVTNIPSLIDAFYIYSQYCFMGKKGQGSLMNAFDYVRSKHDLRSSFQKHIAKMDVNGNISASKEELIVWCAPTGTQYSKSKYAYVTSPITTGVQLKQRINENAKLTEDEIEQREQAKEAEQEARDSGERVTKHVKEKYGIYKKEYLTSQYNRLTKNNFLIPSTPNRIAFSISMPVKINGVSGEAELYIRADQIQTFKLPFTLKDQINSDIEQGIISKEKYSSADDFESQLEAQLKTIHIPYKASLLTRSKQDIDFGVIQNIIDQKLNC